MKYFYIAVALVMISPVIFIVGMLGQAAMFGDHRESDLRRGMETCRLKSDLPEFAEPCKKIRQDWEAGNYANKPDELSRRKTERMNKHDLDAVKGIAEK